ncbi:MAG: magnesium transporter CorA family protein [bacterium]|nr:magnesium transporter CorA family protein [bacterium]
MNRPGGDDLKWLKDNYTLHPLVTSELARPTFYPKAENYSDHIFLILRFPQFNGIVHEIKASEIDLIILPNELIIVQYNEFSALDLLLKKIEEDPALRNEYFESSGAFVAYKILEHLFASLYKEMEHIGQTVDDLEDHLLNRDKAEELVSEISLLRREAIDFKRIVSPNLTILEELKDKPGEVFEKKFYPYIHKLYTINSRLINFIDGQITTLQVINETNESLLSHKISSIMKVLTMFSVIVFPLTLFATVWGMNVEHMPLVGHPFDFWLLLIMMGLGTLGMLVLFKIKKWL